VSTTRAAPAKALAPSTSRAPALFLQRKCACGGSAGLTGECEDCREQKLLGKPLQKKLAVNAPGDDYELEADRVAEQVLRMPAPAPGSPVTQTARTPLVQRHTPTTPSASADDAPPLVHEVLASAGEPLDTTTRAYFEPRFGHDFGDVRVHSDARARASARSVHALAYTVGNHVVFGDGQPWRGAARGLLAHELTHVVQQRGPSGPAGLQRRPSWPSLPSWDDVSGAVSSAASGLAERAAESLGPLDRSTIVSGIEAALRSPLGAIIAQHPAILAHGKSFELIRSSPAALAIVWDLVQDPGKYQARVQRLVEPHIATATRLVTEDGPAALERLRVPSEYRERISRAMQAGAGYIGSACRFVLDEIILDTILFWQLRSEHELYESAWKDYEAGNSDVVDLIIAHVEVVLNAVGRLEDLLPLVLMVGGAASGGAVGAAGGSVVPGAGTAAGGGAGGGTGGAVGTAASEVVGLALSLAPAAIESGKIAKAIEQLVFGEQTENQRQYDVGQIASSAIALVVMGVLAFLPGLAFRAGKKLGNALRDSLPAAGALLPASLPRASATPSAVVASSNGPKPAASAAHSDARPADRAPSESSPPARDTVGSTEIEASVAGSSTKPNAETTPEERALEVAWVEAHPEAVTSDGSQAAIGSSGQHEIVATPTGCERHSPDKPVSVGCPLVLRARVAARAAAHSADPDTLSALQAVEQGAEYLDWLPEATRETFQGRVRDFESRWADRADAGLIGDKVQDHVISRRDLEFSHEWDEIKAGSPWADLDYDDLVERASKSRNGAEHRLLETLLRLAFDEHRAQLVDGRSVLANRRPDGKVVIFDTRTNLFSIATRDGLFDTFFEATEGVVYYRHDLDAQKGRPLPAGPVARGGEEGAVPAVFSEPGLGTGSAQSVASRELLDATGDPALFPGPLPPAAADLELDLVMKSEKRAIPDAGDGYVFEVDLGNGHRWKGKADGTWCRFSTTPTNCTALVPSRSPATSTTPRREALPVAEIPQASVAPRPGLHPRRRAVLVHDLAEELLTKAKPEDVTTIVARREAKAFADVTGRFPAAVQAEHELAVRAGARGGKRKNQSSRVGGVDMFEAAGTGEQNLFLLGVTPRPRDDVRGRAQGSRSDVEDYAVSEDYHDIVREFTHPDIRFPVRGASAVWMSERDIARSLRQIVKTGQMPYFPGSSRVSATKGYKDGALKERPLGEPDSSDPQQVVPTAHVDILSGYSGDALGSRGGDLNERLKKLAYLLFVRESARDKANLVHAMMAIDLIAAGRLSFRNALDSGQRFRWLTPRKAGKRLPSLGADGRLVYYHKGDRKDVAPLPVKEMSVDGERGDKSHIVSENQGGLLPASPPGATRAAQRFAAWLGGTPPASTEKGDVLEAALARQDMLVTAWLELGGVSPDDEAAVTARIRERLSHFYGLTRR
jgi:hypothetical protein